MPKIVDRFAVFATVMLCLTTASLTSPADAQTEFRTLYLGMNVGELTAALQKKGIETVSKVMVVDGKIHDAAIFGTPANSLNKALNDENYDALDLSNSYVSASIEVNDVNLLVIGPAQDIQSPLWGEQKKVGSFIFGKNYMLNLSGYGFVIAASGDAIDKSAPLKEIWFEPKYFDAAGVGVEDFAQQLLNKYDFVDNTLYPAQDKGLTCRCYVGLLKTGEGLTIEQYSDDPLNWSLKVFRPEADYIAKFNQTSANFD